MLGILETISLEKGAEAVARGVFLRGYPWNV